MANTPEKVVRKVNDLLFFDNLALYYLMERVPPQVLARAFNAADGRLAGALLGIMNAEQRSSIHAYMIQENDGDAEKNEQACDALVITANDIYARGFITKQGLHYFGTPKTEKLDPQAGAHH
ncbi:MAG: hypothetical protein NXI24_01380 [bacterium]|nr:hypothetical protein [bacterium]